MDIEYMRIFVKIAEGATFQNVADELNMTQSTISKIIQKLESELNSKLFLREHRTVSLTTFGKYFYDNSKKLISNYDELMQHVHSFQNGKLLLSYILGTEDIFQIVDISNRFKHKYPSVYFSMERFYDLNKLLDNLISDRLDFAILHKPYELSQKIFTYELIKDPLYVILPLNHPLCSQESISINQLSMEYLLISEYNLSYLNDIFKEYAIRPNLSPIMKESKKTTIALNVGMGYGISVFFESDLNLINAIQTKIIKKRLTGIREMPLVFAYSKKPTQLVAEYRDFLAREIQFQKSSNITKQK